MLQQVIKIANSSFYLLVLDNHRKKSTCMVTEKNSSSGYVKEYKKNQSRNLHFISALISAQF